jgi:hypothetical protein
MPWVIGIDEAGYGPNLGPLVQAAVGFLLPDDDPTGWRSFAAVARKSGTPADDRLVIDDSKRVYTAGGFAALERTVTAVTGAADLDTLARAYARGEQTLAGEAWYRGEQPLPLEIDRDDRLRERWIATPVLAEVGTFLVRPYVTATPRFNELVANYGGKAGVLMDRITTLMQTGLADCVHPRTGDDAAPVIFLCDKLGGRHYYGAFLQEVFPECWPVAAVEGPAESRYRLLNLGREVTVSFRPKADGESVPVALASMVAKYLREACMRQFNAFWQSLVPGLTPTAGYPVDAKRYYDAIRPAMASRGLAEDAVWRRR